MPTTRSWRPGAAAGSFQGCKVGIGWQGNPEYVTDNLRSIPLRHFAPLARVRECVFSLQKGPGSEQAAAVRADWPIVEFGPVFDSRRGTFMDTAAVMRNMDLVITSDTALAHLAGGLGVPVWVPLGTACDWAGWTQGKTALGIPPCGSSGNRGWGLGGRVRGHCWRTGAARSGKAH